MAKKSLADELLRKLVTALIKEGYPDEKAKVRADMVETFMDAYSNSALLMLEGLVGLSYPEPDAEGEEEEEEEEDEDEDEDEEEDEEE